MLALENISAINIEMSSRCVGHCPFCSRQQKVRPYGNFDITLADFKKLPRSLLQRLRMISFAGNFGDFCSNPEFPDVAAYAREQNPRLLMDGDTNGSMQNRAWWQRLGSLFNTGSMIIFALDGLADTHALHRRGTDFSKILKNVEAFTSAGGTAFWKFIVFEHNEHQVQAAASLAESIGCAGFVAMSSRDYDDRCRRPRHLEVNIKRDLYQETLESLPAEDRQARCKPFNGGSIYIAADGTVHPCCFAHCMYITEHNQGFGFIVPLIDMYRAEINFKTTPLPAILAHPYFEAVARASRENDYCILKCNRRKKQIRNQLVVYEKRFHRD